jgi:hypothetical protein
MTIPYNTTALQGIKYLRETFEFDKEETNIKNMNYSNIFDHDVENIQENESDLERIEEIRIEEIQSSPSCYDKKMSNKKIWFKHNNNIKLELDDFKELYFILRHILFDVAPSLHLISEYLKDISKICITSNSFIP